MEIPEGLAVRNLSDKDMFFTFKSRPDLFFQFRKNFEVYDVLHVNHTSFQPYLLAPKSLSHWS